MKVFTYPFFPKILYRFGNIPFTLLLLAYLFPVALNLDKRLVLIIPFIITLLIIYFLNKYYIMLYKILPYKIEADDEKMICTDFIFAKKKVTIYYTDVESLTGGIFDGRFKGVQKVCDTKSKMCIGFFSSIKNNKALETIILSKVKKEVYDAVVERVGLRKKK